MKKLVTFTISASLLVMFTTPALSQNVAVIDTQAAILQTQVAQDAFKALEEETEYASMVEQAQQLQNDRQALVESLQKDAETLSNEEITELQKDIQEKTADLEFILSLEKFKPNRMKLSKPLLLN